jgi:hypothetical protein
MVNGIYRKRAVVYVQNTERFMKINLRSVAIHICLQRNGTKVKSPVIDGQVFESQFIRVSLQFQIVSDSGAHCLRKRTIFKM